MTPTAPATFSRGELVADDAERQRDDAAADALDGPGDDHDADGGGHRGEDRADRQRRQDADQHPLLADHVADPTQDRRRTPTRRAGRP